MSPIATPSGHHWSRIALTAFAGGVAAVGLYAVVVATRRLEIRRTTIRIPGLHADLEGLTIAVLSDLHAGRLTPDSVIRRAVRKTLHARPDIITLTGDFVDRDPDDLLHALQLASPLRAPLGVYAVPGNHEHAHGGLLHWRRILARFPHLRDITNRYVVLRKGAAAVCVAGTDDLESGSPRLELPPPHRRDLTILLAHNPDQAESARRADDAIDLVLSGHTHGGQIRLPPVGPIHRKSRRYDQGLQRRPWTQVYTSRGIGNTFLPLRFNARPELALLSLTRSA